MKVDEAVARLCAAGLVCQARSAPRVHVLGGIRTFEAGGLQSYEQPFAILEQPGGGFTIGVAGAAGRPDTEVPATTLGEAVRALLAVIEERGGGHGEAPAGTGERSANGERAPRLP